MDHVKLTRQCPAKSSLIYFRYTDSIGGVQELAVNNHLKFSIIFGHLHLSLINDPNGTQKLPFSRHVECFRFYHSLTCIRVSKNSALFNQVNTMVLNAKKATFVNFNQNGCWSPM